MVFSNRRSKKDCGGSISLPRKSQYKLVLLFLLSAALPRKGVAFDYRIRFSVLPSQEDPGLTLLPSKQLAS